MKLSYHAVTLIVRENDQISLVSNINCSQTGGGMPWTSGQQKSKL